MGAPSPREWARANTGKGDKVPVHVVYAHIVEPVAEILDEMVSDPTVYVSMNQIHDFIEQYHPPAPDYNTLKNWLPRYFKSAWSKIRSRVSAKHGR